MSLELEVIKFANHDYALGAVFAQKLTGGLANVSYAITTDIGKKYVLTLVNGTYEDASRLANLLTILQEKNTSKVFSSEFIVPNAQGKLVTSFQEKPTILKHFIHGQTLERDAHQSDAYIAGSILGNISTISMKEHVPTKPHQFNLEEAIQNWDKIPLVLKPHVKKSISLETEDILKILPSGLIHADMFGDNIIVDESSKWWVIDWECAAEAPLILDIGFTAYSFCRKQGKLDLERLSSLIDGYQSQRELTSLELEALPTVLHYCGTFIAYRRWKKWPDEANGFYMEPLSYLSSLNLL
jgi:homoserine kinase type II